MPSYFTTFKLTSTSLTSATFQLLYGRCYTLFPVKNTYTVANLLFALGSLICTVAPNSIALIAGRAIAGIGVAGIMSGNILTIAASAPLARRASLAGMMFAFLGLASVVGPFVGGVLTDSATWRWCFGTNCLSPLRFLRVRRCSWRRYRSRGRKV